MVSNRVKNQPQRRMGLAIALMLVSSLFTALMGVAIQFGTFSHLTTPSMVFWRNFVGLVCLLPWIYLKKPSFSFLHKIKMEKRYLHVVRGVSNFSAVSLYFWSIQYIDLASATVLFSTMPIFVPIVAWCWRRITILHKLWWGIGIAFGGILLVLQPGMGVFHWGSFLALFAGVLGAVSVVSLRFGHNSETPTAMLFYLFIISLVSAAFCTLFSFKESWLSLSWDQFKILIPIGIFGFICQVLLTNSLKLAPVRLLSPFSYASVIFVIILDQAIWQVSITPVKFLGVVLIIAGASLMVLLYPKEEGFLK